MSRPLNSIGLPYYKSLLLSSWSSQFEPPTPYFPPAQKIPVQVLNTMKFNDNVAYAALPKELKGRRNMVSVVAKKKGGRFRSGKPGKHDVCLPVIFLPKINLLPRLSQIHRLRNTIVKTCRRCTNV